MNGQNSKTCSPSSSAIGSYRISSNLPFTNQLYNHKIMAEEPIFTKIIKGEIPSHKVYEDERTFAFMDIHPIQPGQVLVVPKTEVAFVWDLNEADYQALMATAKKVADRLRQAFPNKSHVGMHVEGLDVAHAHLKVFPFSDHQEFTNHPDMTAEPDHDKLAEIAAKLKF